jgi:PAS domain S-box-containing protein
LSLQRKRTEQASHDSEKRSRAIVQTVIEGVITIDEQGSVRSFNAAAERIFGYPAQEVIGHNVSMLMSETDRSEHDDYMERYFQTGKAKVLATSREVMGLQKNGSEFPMQLAAGEMHLQDKLIFVGTVRDLTESKRIQEKVLQSRNLAALGEMAIAVAHEIKNPLAAIMGVIDVLKNSTSIERN